MAINMKFLALICLIMVVNTKCWGIGSIGRSKTGLYLGGLKGGLIGGRPPPTDTALWCSAGEGADNSTEGAMGESKGDEGGNNPLKRQWMSLSEESRDDIKTTGVSFLFALLLRILIIEPRFIPSLSMFPTFDIGDQLLVEKVSKYNRHYQRHDVVVFNPPEAYIELTGNTEALIKRVVGIAGDKIEVKGNRLYVNGVMQEEPWTNELPNYSLDAQKVPEGMVLVLGDNRNHSFDSHIWGFLPEKNVIGRAVFKYWPPWRVGTIEGSG